MDLNENSSKDGLHGKPTNETTTACGPGCDCGSPSGGGKAKIVITLVVLLVVAGIIAYKAFSGGQRDANNAATGDKKGFAIAATAPNAAPGEEPSAQDRVEPAQAAPSVKNDTRIGQYIKSMSELNKVALNQDAVFIFIPAKEDETAGRATSAAVLSAQKALHAKNVKVGLFTLKTTSPDFRTLSSQVQVPAILVACKGRGMASVSGEVTETKLLQAFMASSRARGCCGASSAGCK